LLITCHNVTFWNFERSALIVQPGRNPQPQLDPAIRPLRLTGREMEDIVIFLGSLTGDNVKTLVRDAFAASIGDRHGTPKCFE